jgi:hypothetical protein
MKAALIERINECFEESLTKEIDTLNSLKKSVKKSFNQTYELTECLLQTKDYLMFVKSKGYILSVMEQFDA